MVNGYIEAMLLILIGTVNTFIMKFITDHTRSSVAISVLMFIGEFLTLAAYAFLKRVDSFKIKYY